MWSLCDDGATAAARAKGMTDAEYADFLRVVSIASCQRAVKRIASADGRVFDEGKNK